MSKNPIQHSKAKHIEIGYNFIHDYVQKGVFDIGYNLSKNPVQHSKAKHIEIGYNFIHDYVQKGVFDMKFVDTFHQWDNIFTKHLYKDRFVCIREHFNMVSLSD